MNPEQFIQMIEAESSRKSKEAILQKALDENCTEFFHGAALAYDALITFGVKKVPAHGGPDGQGLPWSAFKELCNNLIGRKLTGNAAKKAIELCLGASTQAQWNDWYRRILIKDLRCGITEKTINDVLKRSDQEDLVIPVFTCQLAHDGMDHPKKMIGEKLIEVKLDGVRVLTVVYPNGRVDQYSRNGKELVNFEHIKEQIAKTVTGVTEPMVLDGEVMSSSFQDLMKQVHRKSEVKADDAVLWLFDLIPLSAFREGIWAVPQTERSEKVQAWKNLWDEETPNIQVLEHEIVDLSDSEGQNRFREINRKAIDDGFEGIMLKDPSAPYELKRSHSWLKIKPTISVDLEVVGIEEGTGKNSGRLGALVCEGTDNGRRIQVNVGSGFTDEQRDEFWGDQNLVLGNLVEVLADAVTMNQDGSYSLRFPRFVRFRSFEQGNKI